MEVDLTTSEEAPDVIDVREATREDVDSNEEWWMVGYLNELIEQGVVEAADKSNIRIPLSYKVRHKYTEIKKTKTKAREMHLFKETAYTPDFNIYWNPEWVNVIYMPLMQGERYTDQKIPFLSVEPLSPGTCLEVKGSFTKPDELATTNMKRKWVFQTQQIFVQLIRVPDIFEETFYPKAFLEDPNNIYKKDNKPRGIKKGDSKFPGVKTVEQYVSEISVFKSKQHSLL